MGTAPDNGEQGLKLMSIVEDNAVNSLGTLENHSTKDILNAGRLPVSPMQETPKHWQLHGDIENEILLRLPVKTLKRFQCASKSWSSLIASPHFQKDHFLHSEKRPFFLTILTDDRNPCILRFATYNSKDGSQVNIFTKKSPLLYEYNPFLPIQSCRGLVCIVPSDSHSILICNPSTEELISLPPSKRHHRCFGFGYAASTDEFKVVMFYEGRRSSKNLCQVFSSSTCTWKKARSPPFFSSGAAPFLHGALHLMPNMHFENVQGSDYIAAFDIETENYIRIPLPESYHSIVDSDTFAADADGFCLTVVGGSLCLNCNLCGSEGRLEIWLLKEYNNAEWVKRYNVNLSSVIRSLKYVVSAQMIGLMGDGRILLNVFVDEKAELLYYDPQDKVVTAKIHKDCAATFYVESFFPLLD